MRRPHRRTSDAAYRNPLLWFLVASAAGSVSLVPAAAMASVPLPRTSDGTASAVAAPPPAHPRPIVYSVAGSDSGGGAGVQADLLAVHGMGGHGCSAVTCLTAQNSRGVTAVHAPPADFLKSQLDALLADLPPAAVKVGMLGSRELVLQVADSLKDLCDRTGGKGPAVPVVLDPVMISTSGHRLIQEDAQQALVDELFPLVDVVTPNKYEAEALLAGADGKQGAAMDTHRQVEAAARTLLAMGATGVLIKGGHAGDARYSHDYLLLSRPEAPGAGGGSDGARLCDGERGVWLRAPRYDTINTHGTGCTLSSAMATALALGRAERRRDPSMERRGAYSSIGAVDACCLAKAYVTAGISQGQQLGGGPGPVAQTTFPNSHWHFPTIVQNPTKESLSFRSLAAHGGGSVSGNIPRLGRILPIVDTLDWVRRLSTIDGVEDIQLRIKDETLYENILKTAKEAQALCQAANVRLWINDHWKAAIEAGCFGVHIGQEDLFKCIDSGELDLIREQNLGLGISTHSFGELSVALGVRPTYISLGPVFATSSKNVKFDPQGLDIVTKWRQLIPPDIPLVAIGGISNAEVASKVKHAGADCIAVIGAVTQANNPALAVAALNSSMRHQPSVEHM